jgi:hypothetical protein
MPKPQPRQSQLPKTTSTNHKMIPPIDDPVLSSNPKFAALHTTLTATILNPSGSTKKHPAQKERDAVSEVLTTFS